MPWMPRRKTVVQLVLEIDLKQLIQRVAVGEPSGPFLLGAEQLAKIIKANADREANAGGHDLPRFEIGGDAHDRPALAVDVVGRFAVVAEHVRVRKTLAAQTEINAAVVRVERDT